MNVLRNHKIIFITEEFPPEVGGIQSFLSQLVQHLPPAETRVIAKDQHRAEVWDKNQKYGIKRVRTRALSLPRWRPALLELRKSVKEFQPEIIVCGKGLFEGRAARKIWHEKKIPYVVFTYAMEISTWLGTKKNKRELLRVLHDASRVVVINDVIKKILIKEGISEKKIVKFYPGVDDYYLEKDISSQKFSDTLGLGKKRIIVSVCRLIKRKGLDVLIRALPQVLEKIENAILVIIGDGPERKFLEKLADETGVSGNVRFLGKISRDDIRMIFQESELFALTPKNEKGDFEGFGIVYLDAAASGLCSVGSRSGGVPEAIIDNKTGLLANENDPKDTADKITKILMDPEMRKLLATDAKKRVLDDFIWEKRIILFRGIMEAVINEKLRK